MARKFRPLPDVKTVVRGLKRMTIIADIKDRERKVLQEQIRRERGY